VRAFHLVWHVHLSFRRSHLWLGHSASRLPCTGSLTMALLLFLSTVYNYIGCQGTRHYLYCLFTFYYLYPILYTLFLII
ncbi:hypothetical protein B0I35DRAFT_492360, partial [Stachybotrys elegans]